MTVVYMSFSFGSLIKDFFPRNFLFILFVEKTADTRKKNVTEEPKKNSSETGVRKMKLAIHKRT